MRKAFDLFKSQRNSVDAQPDFQNAWAFLNQNGGGSLGFDPGADLQNDPRARAVRALLGQGNATDADLKFFADAGHAPSYLTPGTYKTQNPFDMDPSDPTVQASRDTLNMLASGSTAGGAGGAQAGRSAYTGSPSAAPATQPGAAPPGTFEMGDARPFTPRPLGGGTMAGPSSGIPPAPVPAPPRGAAVGGGNNVGTITGNEVPYSVNPTRSADLQGLLGGLTGEAQRQLANPSVYDDELFKSAQRLAEQGLDESYGTAQRRLEGNLAKRGLNWSSVAAGDLSDLEVSRQRAGDEMRTGLLRDRAASIGSARSAAFNNARGVFGDTAGLEANERGEMRGERGYTDDLRTQARNEAIQELLMDEQFQGSANSEWQQYLQQALGFGFQSPGGGAASNAYANAANQYGAQAGSDPWLQYLMSLSAS